MSTPNFEKMTFEEMDQYFNSFERKGNNYTTTFYENYPSDKDLHDLAAEFQKKAAPMIPILKNVVKELKKTGANVEAAKMAATGRLQHIGTIENLLINTCVLLHAIEDVLPVMIEGGGNIVELRKTARYFERYLREKADRERKARREAFEASQEYRLQMLEKAAGTRDRIEYPEGC